MSIGRVIRQHRESWRITQGDLADYVKNLTGLKRSVSYISCVENGKTSPTLEELEGIAIVLKIRVVDLIEESKGIKPSEGSELLRMYEVLTKEDRACFRDMLETVAKGEA